MGLKAELSRILPRLSKAEAGKVVKGAFESMITIEVEHSLHDKRLRSPEEFDDIEGLAHLNESLALGKGALLVTFHFCDYMHVLPALGLKGYKVAQVANDWAVLRQSREGSRLRRLAGEFLLKLRRAHSADVLPVEIITLKTGASVRPILRNLGQNGTVVIAADGREFGRKLDAPLLDRSDFSVGLGPAKLSLKSGAALHPIFVIRKPDGNYRLVIEPALSAQEGATGNEHAASIFSRELVTRLAPYVREFPQEYLLQLFFDTRLTKRRDEDLEVGESNSPSIEEQ